MGIDQQPSSLEAESIVPKNASDAQWTDLANNFPRWGFAGQTPDGIQLRINQADNQLYGQDVDGAIHRYGEGQIEGNVFSLGGSRWELQPDLPGREDTWMQIGTQPQPTSGYDDPALAGLSAPGQWQTMRTREMGKDIWNPSIQRTMMHGYEPAYGRFVIESPMEGEFYKWLGGKTDISHMPALDREQAWRNMVAASRSWKDPGSSPFLEGQDLDMAYFNRLQAQLDPFNEDHKRNAVLAVSAIMGAGPGSTGNAIRGSVNRLYDVYATRQGSGQGFVNWMNQRMFPTSAQPSLFEQSIPNGGVNGAVATPGQVVPPPNYVPTFPGNTSRGI